MIRLGISGTSVLQGGEDVSDEPKPDSLVGQLVRDKKNVVYKVIGEHYDRCWLLRLDSRTYDTLRRTHLRPYY